MFYGWQRALERAEQEGKFSAADKKAAGSWLTCAVGETFETTADTLRSATIPIPEDSDVIALGMDFMWHVNQDEVLLARGVFQQIQQSRDAVDNA